jgi:hypothetical protein
MRHFDPILMSLTLVAIAASSTSCAAEKLEARPAPGQAQDADSYLRYAHRTIREPFVDLLNLSVPAELKDQPLAALGYVDVTGKPFRADPTGQTDWKKGTFYFLHGLPRDRIEGYGPYAGAAKTARSRVPKGVPRGTRTLRLDRRRRPRASSKEIAYDDVLAGRTTPNPVDRPA